MSQLLYRWGRWAAGHAWMTVGIWVVLAVAVAALASTAGHPLDNTMAAPGTDSKAAADLLARAGTGTGGLTSYVVATPRAEDKSFLDSPRARRDLAEVEQQLSGLKDQLGATDPAGLLAKDPEAAVAAQQVSADGRVAIIRLQYPVIEQTDKSALAALTAALARAQSGSCLLYTNPSPRDA
jgi:RND superfamily putative drug exporter